jgi:hypothetical protein
VGRKDGVVVGPVGDSVGVVVGDEGAIVGVVVGTIVVKWLGVFVGRLEGMVVGTLVGPGGDIEEKMVRGV